MKNPTKAQVQVVINNLMKVLPMAQKEENLCMMQGTIPDEIGCGTTCCHGGWYYVAKCIGNQREREKGDDYTIGSQMMAKDLGYEDQEELRMWIHHNPQIWNEGVSNGDNNSYIFSEELAFYHPEKRSEGAKTLQDIISHWEEVRDRLKI